MADDHADQYPVANNGKNGESSVGSHAPQLIQTEPITPAVQDEAVPLSGSPYFTCIVSKSQTQSPFQLAVPRRFCSLLPSESVSVFLSCERRTWEMRYCGSSSLKRFDRGWKKFAIDNNLKIGDGCVFELTDHKNMKFQVRILRGEIPSPVVDSAGGQSYDTPIMID
ncbi:B3 domain-containing protein Os04g0386900-like [Phoenix dactylifera]|uniref:B3 domain-containing protein Os04g0386900-like n=1 Tax=Phoenix dactylifera TaxID=42345 RepID=A0A8B9A8A2_PHODC|nr:B3 domain-containing protein Os04g0386900-like [Phoenix dactylifera]